MARPRKGREEEVLVAFEAYVRQNGRSPSMRELAGICGLATASSVYRYLSRLKAEGRITWEPNLSRTMRSIADEEAV